MPEFIHTADWHLGAPKAHPVFSTALEVLIQKTKSLGISCIVCSGDVFDQPRPDQKVKDYLLRCLLKNPEITFIFCVGNHDYTDKAKSYYSTKYLKLLRHKLEHVHVLTPGKVVTIKDVSFVAADTWEGIYKLDRNEYPSGYLVALWHGIAPSIVLKDLSGSATPLVKAPKNVDYIALGDIHKRWRLSDNCAYPGSLYQKTYSDEAGVVRVRLGATTSVRHLHLTLPAKVMFEASFENGKDTEADIVQQVKNSICAGNIVKLRFHLPPSIFGAMNKQMIKDSLTDYCLLIELENNPMTEARNRQDSGKVAKADTLADELSIVLNSMELDVDKEKLLKKVEEIVQAVGG